MIRRPRPFVWLREHPRVTDVLLTVIATGLTVAIHIWNPDADDFNPRDPAWWTVGLLVAATCPLLLRRRYPLGSAWFLLIGIGIAETLRIASGAFIPMLIAIYSVGAYAEGRRRTWNAIAMGALVGVSFYLEIWTDVIEGYNPDLGLVDVVATYGIMTAAIIVGDNVRRRRLHVIDLSERAERAERERDLLARERVNDERARIARELHDVIAHSVSAIVIQARAARRAIDNDPATSRELLDSIEGTGRQAMNELRRVLGVLRDNEANGDLAPQPSLADVDDLIAANSDLPIELTVNGEVGGLPAGLGLSVYRILQEALTNVRRHAGSVEHVRVAMEADGEGFHLTIDDDGRGAASVVDRDDDSIGYGVLGMNERVAASNGELHVGPRPGGGWRVTAHFPNGAA